MNIGAFALVSAALPSDAGEQRRQVAAEAALRGMNAAVLWSPFFISFAVAGIYLPVGFAPGAILLGIFLSFSIFYNYPCAGGAGWGAICDRAIP